MLDFVSCWFLKPKVFILGGRYGDIIQCLPALREFGKPIVITSEEYASVFEGVSYVEAMPMPVHWCDGIPKMQAMAKERFGGGTVVQWWGIGNIPPDYRGSFALKWNGKTLSINQKRWPTYGHSMIERIGCEGFILVFDKRNYERESDLLHMLPSKKPLLLYNFTGTSSPFGYVPEIWPVLQAFKKEFHLIDIGKIKAHRIYDLLGLYDAAVGLITGDTATLHLAPASNVPYIAFTQVGWLGSVPRGNCALNIPYNQVLRRLHEVKSVLEQWKRATSANQPMLVSQHA